MTEHRSAQVIVLQGVEPATSETNAARLVELMGGKAEFVQLANDGGITWIRETIPHGAAIIVRAETLAKAMKSPVGASAEWLEALTGIAGGCFVFDFNADYASDRLLHELTAGSFRSVEGLASPTARLEVSSDSRDICRQLSGLAFDAEMHGTESVFVRGQVCTGVIELIRLGGRPHLVGIEHRTTALMLLASGEIADPDESPKGRAAMAGVFPRLAPLLMFLRRVGGDRLWHHDSPGACLIVDDPLLRPRYGFLNFERLLAVMQAERFSTSIAFIPWNYRRSDRRVVELFRRFPMHLSLSIHGCDHTGAEFASTNRDFLCKQAATALSWMTKHRELTGVDFDDVMVFPQGHFSSVAMEVLQSCGYLAAVNSNSIPVDGAAEPLQLRDLLDVAVTKFSGFPLFVRHYPDDVAGLALDLFLGKPALLVEHHGYFEQGYESLAATVRALHRMERHLHWTNLSTICRQACWMRKSESGETFVRFYTSRFELHNDTGQTRPYLLQYGRGNAPLVSIELDGCQSEVVPTSDGTVARVELRAGEIAKLEARWNRQTPHAVPRRPLGWRAKVVIRRGLSELRDNHVDRYPLLKRMASRVRKRLVRSG